MEGDFLEVHIAAPGPDGLGNRAEEVVSIISVIDADRAASLQGRIEADERLRDHALSRPVFGWGGWNRFREGIGPTLPDSLWAITLGQRGFFGLISLFTTLVLPAWLVLRRARRGRVPIARCVPWDGHR